MAKRKWKCYICLMRGKQTEISFKENIIVHIEGHLKKEDPEAIEMIIKMLDCGCEFRED